MPNKNIYVTKPFLPSFDEYSNEIRSIWGSYMLTNDGPLYDQFLIGLCEYLNADNATLFVNGHMALDLAIKALRLKGEVITTPYTFVSTTHALVMNGITPVFCDIDNDTYNIDENKIEALITDKTSAILAVHVYGTPCNVDALNQIAQKHNLMLVYDAAHAFGVKINGVPITQYGDISMLSFHATKVFHTIEGGALIYKDALLKQTLANLRNFGINGPESILAVGLNAKMNEFVSAMGICNLRHVDEQINSRKIVTEHYDSKLRNKAGIKLFKRNDNVHYNYAYYPILIDDKITGFSRDELFIELQKQNIFARKYFYPLITNAECYKESYAYRKTPVAAYVADHILTLPLYADLSEEDIDRICDIILSMVR